MSTFKTRLLSIFVFVCLLVTLSFSEAQAAGRIFRVTPAGLVSGNCGGTWASACSLQHALKDLAGTGDALWVSAGTYRPTTGLDPSNTNPGFRFILRNGIAIYGGFAGTETVLEQRNPAIHVTVLSGDIGVAGVTSDNSYHVVGAGGTNNTASLNGFTITGGNARGNDNDSLGGGVLILSGSPTLTNVTISQNSASHIAGGIYNAGGSPTLTNVTISQNSASYVAGGIYNASGNPSLTNVTISQNSGYSAGGMYNINGSPTLINVTFHGNSTNGLGGLGGGMLTLSGTPTLTNVIFSDNSAIRSAGAMYIEGGSPILTDVTFFNNSSQDGAGMYIQSGSPTLASVTFSGNIADNYGGGIYNGGNSPIFTNVTFFNNQATNNAGGGMHISSGSPTLTNVTFSNNRAPHVTNGQGGGINIMGGSPTLSNVILWGNTAATGSQIHNAGSLTISDSVVEGGYGGGTNIITNDPHLGTLGYYGGSTETIPLQLGSSAIDSGNAIACPEFDQRGLLRPQGEGCDIGAYERGLLVAVTIGNSGAGSYPLAQGDSTRVSFAGVDNGPVKIVSTDGTPIIASERINLLNHPAVESYTEFMGLPATQVTDTYLFPWYNNVSLDSQLRFANVGTAPTTVTVRIGTQVNQTYPLAVNESKRISYPVDTGPVVIESSGDVPIIASERVNLLSHPSVSSYTEFIGLLGSSTAGTRYLFPWYNNVGLDSQLRFANVGTAPTIVTVKIGTTVNQTYPLAVNESKRISYPGVDTGPVEVASSDGVPIIASERINLLNHPSVSSYTEFLGLSGTTLTHTKYLFPWYNNVSLDSQLRVANVGTTATTVRIKIGTQVNEIFSLGANESRRLTYPVDTGPVTIESSGSVPIIASERVNLLNHPAVSSYAEFIGLSVGDPLGWPGNQLSDTFWFPWYNNVGLDSQLRFGVP